MGERFNKIMVLLSLVAGIAVSVYVGLCILFIGGLQQVIIGLSVVDSRVVTDTWNLYCGSIKMVLSGFTFWFILGFFLSTARNFARNNEEDNG